MIRSVLLLAHSLVYQGLKLPGVDGRLCFEKNDDAYADNVDTWGCNTEVGNEAAVP